MVKLLLGLAAVPSPHDAADALAVAICHVHAQAPAHVATVAGCRQAAESSDELAPLPAVIAHLRGRILEKHPNRVIVDVGGVGYDVAVPLSTFYGLGEPGAEVALRVHTHVREDALALYGFATRARAAICSSG